MSQIRRCWRIGLTVISGSCLLLTAGAKSPSDPERSADILNVTLLDRPQDQSTSTPNGAMLAGKRPVSVILSGANSEPAAGSAPPRGRATQLLANRATYGTRVGTVDVGGNASSMTTKFATVPTGAGSRISSTLGLQGGEVIYGVGMPVPVVFSQPVPDNSKADIERRLSVHSDPPQTGAWRWYGDQQVIYRPKDYWQPGTKLTITTPDQTVAATIGRKTTFEISDATKQMRVYQDDSLVKTFPVSLGAPETPSSSGNMVIMTREPHAVWVYSADYQLDVSYAERLTVDGEYIHAAPWSVAEQGNTDVSHGCTNLSPGNAEWVYNNSQIGDPVTVSGTRKHVGQDNGWTVWDLSWADYVKGDALPHTG